MLAVWLALACPLSVLGITAAEMLNDPEVVETAAKAGLQSAALLEEKERRLHNLTARLSPPRFQPARPSPPQAQATARLAEMYEAATIKLLEVGGRKISKRSARHSRVLNGQLGAQLVLPAVRENVATKIRAEPVGQTAVAALAALRCGVEDAACRECFPGAHYRSFSGCCNNLAKPDRGAALSPLARLLPPEYKDGVARPRLDSVLGSPLPNPRIVSTIMEQPGLTGPDTQHSSMVMQWGQLVDHDITLIPQYRGLAGDVLDCRACNSSYNHPACFPILLPRSDKFFSAGRAVSDSHCLPFTRSLPGQQSLGPRHQLNALSAYLDGSAVYGSDGCRAGRLRETGGARLLGTTNPGRGLHARKELLPLEHRSHECRAADGRCFMAGDERANEQPGLTAVHTLLLREHNRLVSGLMVTNPHWDEERLYQEARRIVAATIQHITFSEWLPRVLGPVTSRRYRLQLQQSGYYRGYSPDCSAAVTNEFATAAFRFGHSMVRANISLVTEEDLTAGKTGLSVPLRAVFHSPALVRTGSAIDSLVMGLAMSPMEQPDQGLTEEVRNHLFEKKGQPGSGLDLAALNIQRGREHGLPGYNKYRQLCGLVPSSLVARLREVYAHPDDVDLFPGLLLERRLEGAMVGPTLACILADQFSRLRQCDRYWYEAPTTEQQHGFTAGQLEQLRKQTLSSLVCRNCDRPGRMPRAGMDMMGHHGNVMVDCDSLPPPDLGQWKE